MMGQQVTLLVAKVSAATLVRAKPPQLLASSSGFSSLSQAVSSGTLRRSRVLAGFFLRMEPRDSSVMLWIWGVTQVGASSAGGHHPRPAKSGCLSRLHTCLSGTHCKKQWSASGPNTYCTAALASGLQSPGLPAISNQRSNT